MAKQKLALSQTFSVENDLEGSPKLVLETEYAPWKQWGSDQWGSFSLRRDEPVKLKEVFDEAQLVERIENIKTAGLDAGPYEESLNLLRNSMPIRKAS